MTSAVATIPGYCVDEQCGCHNSGKVIPATFIQFGLDGVPPKCCNRCGRRGPKPLTIVPPQGEVTLEEMAGRVEKTMREHGPLLNEFHRVWYESGHTWPYTHFAGIGVMKNPNDLWIYQVLLTENRPKTIIETGTYSGGSALWLAFLMDFLGIDGGRILTIDLDDHRRCSHPRITFLSGDSTDPALAAAVLAEVKHPLLVTLDADHSAEHVRKELELYAPDVRVGEYLIVEDTNIGWDGPEGDRGARGGVEDYLRKHPGEFRQDILCERYLLSMNPGGWLQRIAECAHA